MPQFPKSKVLRQCCWKNSIKTASLLEGSSRIKFLMILYYKLCRKKCGQKVQNILCKCDREIYILRHFTNEFQDLVRESTADKKIEQSIFLPNFISNEQFSRFAKHENLIVN